MYCIKNHCCVSKSNFLTHNPHVTVCIHTESIAHTKVQNKKNISCKIMIEIVFRFLNKIMDDKESLPAVLFLLRGQTVIWMFYWYRSNCWLDRDSFCSVWKYHTAKKATPLPPHFRRQGRLFSRFLHTSYMTFKLYICSVLSVVKSGLPCLTESWSSDFVR